MEVFLLRLGVGTILSIVLGVTFGAYAGQREGELPSEREIRFLGMAGPGGSRKYAVADFGASVCARRFEHAEELYGKLLSSQLEPRCRHDQKILVGGPIEGEVQLEKAISVRATDVKALLEAINSQQESKPGKERRVSHTWARV